MRMAVTATVMLLAFVVAGNLQFCTMSRDRARYLAPICGAFIGPVIVGLIQGLSLVEVFSKCRSGIFFMPNIYVE